VDVPIAAPIRYGQLIGHGRAQAIRAPTKPDQAGAKTGLFSRPPV
jgi:hypothetical protein